MTPPFDLAGVDAATRQGMAEGHRVLQTHRYAESDADHVQILLDIINPPQGAMVLDAGCGIGEVSRIMALARPDLNFILMNVSMYQLSQCPRGDQFLHALDDCHATMITDGFVDVVMFSSALCQMDIEVALAEAHRMLKPGGILFINDMVRTHGDVDPMEQALAARVLPRADLLGMVGASGFTLDQVKQPDFNDDIFRGKLKVDNLEHVIDGVFPIIIKAIKGASL